jgi:hypothetical protein
VGGDHGVVGAAEEAAWEGAAEQRLVAFDEARAHALRQGERQMAALCRPEP